MSQAFDPGGYGPALELWLRDASTPPLDAGLLARETLLGLRGLGVSDAFAHAAIADRGMADCCLAGVWLLHNGLDGAHALCQDVPTPTGSYWHGVMHRREGDFWNAKYWFDRAGEHPACEAIGDEPWDAADFVDRVECALRSGDADLRQECLDLQWAEWRALFDWTYRAAIG